MNKIENLLTGHGNESLQPHDFQQPRRERLDLVVLVQVPRQLDGRVAIAVVADYPVGPAGKTVDEARQLLAVGVT